MTSTVFPSVQLGTATGPLHTTSSQVPATISTTTFPEHVATSTTTPATMQASSGLKALSLPATTESVTEEILHDNHSKYI